MGPAEPKGSGKMPLPLAAKHHRLAENELPFKPEMCQPYSTTNKLDDEQRHLGVCNYPLECKQMINYMADVLKLPKLDGMEQANLKWAEMCISEYGMEVTRQAIECIPIDDFWKNKCTSAKILYNNMAKILKGSKLNIENNTYAKYTTK